MLMMTPTTERTYVRFRRCRGRERGREEEKGEREREKGEREREKGERERRERETCLQSSHGCLGVVDLFALP